MGGYEITMVNPEYGGVSVTNRPALNTGINNFYPIDELRPIPEGCRAGEKWEDTCVNEVKYYGYYLE